MRYYIKQNLVINLSTGLDLGSATHPKIRYKNPDGVSGIWNGTINGTNISYTLTNTDVTVSGTWKMQAHVQINSLDQYGDVIQVKFEDIL